MELRKGLIPRSLVVLSGAVSLLLLFSVEGSSVVKYQPRVHIQYQTSVVSYPIEEDDEVGIRDQLRRLGPRDTRGVPRDAFTRWHIAWDMNGAVSPESEDQISLRVRREILVPRLRTTRGQGRDRWRNYRFRLIEHEFNHGSFVVEAMEQLKTALEGDQQRGALTLKQLHERCQYAVKSIQDRDNHYDIETDNGKTEGVRW